MKTVHIAGAGLGGMVAAVNLARAGREVLVLDAGKTVGGIRDYHPSVHGTPMDLELVRRYAGVDVEPCVQKLDRCIKLCVWGDEYVYDPENLSHEPEMLGVERGSGETSIDSLLYNEARKLGVKFEFSTFIGKPKELPPGSIIATGLYPEMFDNLDIPYEQVEGYHFRVPAGEKDRFVLSWIGDFTFDYFYAIAMNDVYYGLLFQRGPLDYGNLVELEKKLKERYGEEFTWHPVRCRVPVKRFRQPRIFIGDYILGGSLTGMMDPMALFGIHGALLSGKVAALAVLDPDRAKRDFSFLTHYYSQTWIMRKIVELFPLQTRRRMYHFSRDHLAEFLKRYIYYFRPLIGLTDKGIPGFSGGWLEPSFKPHELEERRAAMFDKLLTAAGRAAPRKDIRGAIEALKAGG